MRLLAGSDTAAEVRDRLVNTELLLRRRVGVVHGRPVQSCISLSQVVYRLARDQVKLKGQVRDRAAVCAVCAQCESDCDKSERQCGKTVP